MLDRGDFIITCSFFCVQVTLAVIAIDTHWCEVCSEYPTLIQKENISSHWGWTTQRVYVRVKSYYYRWVGEAFARHKHHHFRVYHRGDVSSPKGYKYAEEEGRSRSVDNIISHCQGQLGLTGHARSHGAPFTLLLPNQRRSLRPQQLPESPYVVWGHWESGDCAHIVLLNISTTV